MGRSDPSPHAQLEEPGWLSAAVRDARDWCEGRSALLRLPLLMYLAVAFVRHLRDPLYGSFLFGGITLGVHELGHVIFGFAGRFLAAAGGSVAQLAAPILSAVMFVRQRDYFGVAVAASWLSFSLFNLATYIGDARERDLPLVSIAGGEPSHDWHDLLSSAGLLSADRILASLVRSAGALTGGASLLVGAWLLYEMVRATREKRLSAS